MKNLLSFPYSKAVSAFVVPLVGALLLVITGDMTLGDLSTAQWLVVAFTVLGSPAAVYSADAPELKSGLTDTQVPADVTYPADSADLDLDDVHGLPDVDDPREGDERR